MTAITRLCRVSLSLIAMVALAASTATGQVGNRQPREADAQSFERIDDLGLPDLDVMPELARAHIERGDHLIGERDYRGARKAYAAAIELIRQEDGFPVVPLRRLANAYYFDGRNQAALQTLDRLAEEAAEVGDVLTQVWAQADAAWVLSFDCSQVGPAGCPGGALELEQRLEKLRRLLASPYLPDVVRTAIVEKRCGGTCRLQTVAHK